MPTQWVEYFTSWIVVTILEKMFIEEKRRISGANYNDCELRNGKDWQLPLREGVGFEGQFYKNTSFPKVF